MEIVGLVDKWIAKSREHGRAALSSFGLTLLAKNIAVKLFHDDLLKEGDHFDLPIKIGLA